MQSDQMDVDFDCQSKSDDMTLDSLSSMKIRYNQHM